MVFVRVFLSMRFLLICVSCICLPAVYFCRPKRILCVVRRGFVGELESLCLYVITMPYYSYPRRQSRSAWVRCSSPSVCLFVCPQYNSKMIPKCSNLVHGMTLGYSRNGIVWEFTGQRSKCIFHTNDYIRLCEFAHLTDNSNTAWV